MKRLFALVLLTMPATAQMAWAEPDPWANRLNTGMAECNRMYGGPQLKACAAQVRHIMWVLRHPQREMPTPLIQPNALFGLPWDPRVIR